MTGQDHPRRPGWVTWAVVLMYIGGITQIALGIVTLFLRYAPDVASDGIALGVTLVGAGVILFGLFVVALASGVGRGSRASRLTATVVILLGLALALTDLVVAVGTFGALHGSRIPKGLARSRPAGLP